MGVPYIVLVEWKRICDENRQWRARTTTSTARLLSLSLPMRYRLCAKNIDNIRSLQFQKGIQALSPHPMYRYPHRVQGHSLRQFQANFPKMPLVLFVFDPDVLSTYQAANIMDSVGITYLLRISWQKMCLKRQSMQKMRNYSYLHDMPSHVQGHRDDLLH